MKSLFEGMTGIQKLLLIVFVITIAVSIFFYYTKGAGTAIVVSLLVFVFLSITSAIWRTNRSGNVQVRILSLGLASATVFSFGFWQQFVENGIQFLINKYIPAFKDYPIQSVAPGLVLAFVLVVIFIVNYFNRDTTVMGIHPAPIEEDIPERSFNDRLKGVCISLLDDLKSIDKSTNWSTQYFTPLDAEVEINTNNKKQKRVLDLLNAIKRSKARLFIVFGDPGSGKSVALRKLCQDLLQESTQTGKIPVYINLKEWALDKKWNENNPPTVVQLQQFIIENLKSRDIVTSKFFDKYYDILYETGRLYFVLDSFDEIPSVLEESENSELIIQLSKVIFKFLKGARAEQSQGILASRNFRRPTKEFQADVTLSIRPFSEKSIIQSFKQRGQHDQYLLKKLFKDRPELVPVARNPFAATLIAEYIENNKNSLPSTQSEMYASYISRTLESCTNELNKKGLFAEQVVDCAVVIAEEMFSKYGLEAPVDKLRASLISYNVDAVLHILRFARLGRGNTTSSDNTFSFVHRRFAEYFYVQSMLLNEHLIKLNDIPSDSQQRDALVLYCEVADDDKVIHIANFCWNTIKQINNPQDIRAIHCMRFLRDAFKGRINCIEHFVEDLAKYILSQIRVDSNILTMKLSLETVGLLKHKDVEEILIKALEIGNYWTNETAFKSCRHLSKMSHSLQNSIIKYLYSIPFFVFLLQYKEVIFYLSLSDNSKRAKKHAIYRKIDCYYFFFATIALIAATFAEIIFLWPLIILSTICAFTLSSTEDILRIDLITIRKTTFAMTFGALLAEASSFIIGEEFNYHTAVTLPIAAFILYPFYTISTDIRHIKKRLFRYIMASIFIFAIVFSAFMAIIKQNAILDHIFLFISLLFVFKSIYSFIKNYIRTKIEKKRIIKINTSAISSREEVYNIYTSIKEEENKALFLSILNKNNQSIKGEWPNDSIFKIDSNESTILLAKLETKWRGIAD